MTPATATIAIDVNPLKKPPLLTVVYYFHKGVRFVLSPLVRNFSNLRKPSTDYTGEFAESA
ncbi:MAG TPA: hypothetical protein VJW17_12750 [Pyrinomonadaceae bacterium]|nr:hypothetical protein [Pyrinomonadaceae bacterium]